ncbi:MAG: glycosyltransferase family 9 protein [Vicingaceae bacterium]
MKPSSIKWVDRRIGVITCFILSTWQSIFSFSKKDRPSNKILFIKLIEQGASVLAYSALKEAVEKVGKKNVFFLVFEENRPILDFLNVLEPDNIIVIRNKGYQSFIIDLLKALRFIRNQKIDSCVDMEFFSRASAIIAYLSGARKRVGLYSFTSEHPYRGKLITHKIHYNPYVHVSNYYLMLVRALEEKQVNEPLLKTPVEQFKVENPTAGMSETHLNAVKDKLGKAAIGKKLIVLNPNASDMLPLRKWDTANFEVLANKIQQLEKNYYIVFTGVEKERKQIGQLTVNLKEENYCNLAGKTSLEELMALYQLSSAVITNDSGPAHFASLFKTQVIVLFGPETPDLFAPVGENIHVIYKKLACSPCVNVFNHRFSPCTNNVCMQNIRVDEVFEKLKIVLK